MATTARLHAVGFWFNAAAPSAYPRPQWLVGRWREPRRARVLAYLRAGAVLAAYRARSFCRFACGAPTRQLGHRDLSDGVWVWPEGLAHYVDAHDVRLPDSFVRHVLARGVPPTRLPRWTPAERVGLIDESRWLAWGRAQHATLALAGWTVPGWAAQRVLATRLARAISRDHVLHGRRGDLVLAHADDDAVVIALATGELAIVQLARAAAPTRILAGWEAWPRARGGVRSKLSR